jgi:hypothetical protein
MRGGNILQSRRQGCSHLISADYLFFFFFFFLPSNSTLQIDHSPETKADLMSIKTFGATNQRALNGRNWGAYRLPSPRIVQAPGQSFLAHADDLA